MNIRIISRREPWMTQPEWRHALRHRRALLQHLEGRGVALTPYIAARVQDFLVLLTLVLRMEQVFTPAEGEETTPPVPTLAQLEEIAVARERVARLLAEIVGAAVPCHGESTARENAVPEEYPQPDVTLHETTSENPPATEPETQMAPLPGGLLLTQESAEPEQVALPGTPLNRRQRRALARVAA